VHAQPPLPGRLSEAAHTRSCLWHAATAPHKLTNTSASVAEHTCMTPADACLQLTLHKQRQTEAGGARADRTSNGVSKTQSAVPREHSGL
jgi:hypothetical protein